MTFQAIKGALVTSIPLTVVVGNVPYGPTLKLRYPFDDAGPGTTTPSDTSLGSEVNVTLQMISSDWREHRSPRSGRIGGSRADQPQPGFESLDEPQPGEFGRRQREFRRRHQFGPWFGKRQQLRGDVVDETVVLPAGELWSAHVYSREQRERRGHRDGQQYFNEVAGPLLQWYFYVNTVQATAAFGSNLPTNSWMFVAMAYDGANVTLYEGSDQNSATLISTTAAAGQTVNLDSTAALFLGNRPDRGRCFAGWIDDFRVYTGSGDASFVESVRQSAAGPGGLTAMPGNNQVTLTWNALLGATSYNVKRSTVSGGPYTTISTPGTVTGTSYVDSTAVGGITYYYMVSAATSIGPAGETANSATEASVVTGCAPPAAPSVSYNSPIYAGMTLNLTASTVAGATYSWTGPNGFTSTNQNLSIANVTAAATGDYNVTVTVGDCTSAPATVTVAVNPAASMSVQALSGSLILDWPFGTFQSATNVTGPWNDVMGIMPPYTNAPTKPQEFFRVRLQ